MSTNKIFSIFEKKDKITTADVVSVLGTSRQYASKKISELVRENKLVKVGSTRNAFYIKPEHALDFPNKFKKVFVNKNLEEHIVLNKIETALPILLKLDENAKNIFIYAFSEMMNNAIEHSQSEKIEVSVLIEKNNLSFVIDDFGVGVFKNIMNKKMLGSEIEAIQDLLKGKTTTMPRSHSGEGIFFTSKAGDLFSLDSYGYKLIIDNNKNDTSWVKNRSKKGTRVEFEMSLDSNLHLSDLFKRYTIPDEYGDRGFDKTEIKIKLYAYGGVFISRSQARRVLNGLDKFKLIVLDFDNVPLIGQAFSDEIFRVFKNKYPEIKIESINTNEAVQFMIERVDKK